MIIFIFLISLILTIIIEWKLIPRLNAKAAQPIYEEGPSWHISKKGTPTMGGIAFLISITASLFIFCLVSGGNKILLSSVLISMLFSIGNAAIGIIDDMTKLRRKTNAGLKSYEKLILQTLIAIIFLMSRAYFLGDDTVLRFSFFEFDIGALYYLLALIIILGTVNCANLTDGIDGLASSIAVTIGLSFLIIGISGSNAIKPLSAALIGGALGFLFFNINPAKVFMGDTGSLFLGGLVCSLAFEFGNPTVVLFLGGVYAIEGLSVILQVTYFKLTKKRLFRMSPIHHHLEKCGLRENTICIIAVCLTTLLTIIAALLFRL